MFLKKKKKRMNFRYINNMNKSEQHYAEKSKTQEYILSDSIYMKFKNRLSLIYGNKKGHNGCLCGGVGERMVN